MVESTHLTGTIPLNMIVTLAVQDSGCLEAFLHLLREVLVREGAIAGVFVLAFAGLKMQTDVVVIVASPVLVVSLAFRSMLVFALSAVRTPRLAGRPRSGAGSVPTTGSAAVSGLVTSVS